ncbi:MAG: tRNA lysidine(34) synthetase TilS [Pyrinomonadaceae bacterium]
MKSFPRKLITEWRRLGLPIDGGTVIVACSGGADSTALLLAVKELTDRKKLRHSIVAAHFDHRLRKDSGEDAAFVRNLCKDRGIDFVLGSSPVAKRGNLEENARNARYAFLTKTAKKHGAFAVLTGHTVNDQAETFLLNLVRGSGPDGLTAMPTARPLAKCEAELVRPLLRIATREETVAYCGENDVHFRSDPMNEDARFARVRIRREVLPLLSELNPRIVQTLARTAEQFAQMPRIEPPGEKLRSSELLKLNESERLALIRAWIVARQGSSRRLTFAHINAVDKLLTSTKSGRRVELPGKAVVERSGGWLAYRTE